MKQNASEADVSRVVDTIEQIGYKPHILPGTKRIAIAVTGNSNAIDPTHFEHLSGVAETIRITKPYKLADKNGHLGPLSDQNGDSPVKAGEFTIIAGPCAVESADQVFTVAETVAKSGIRYFRGGAFKPRTSPYAFQGLGEEGLKILAQVRDQFGLKIVTEAMDEHGVDLVEKYGDVIQIGARNMQNFSLLKYAGKATKPVLLKRGLSATLDELLLAAEYIMTEGNQNVILCERGIRTFANQARNTLDLSIIPAVKRASHLPILVDPSHGTGKNYMVKPMALAGVAAGADGLLIEVHPEPEKALCDGAQALTPGQYIDLLESVRLLYQAMSPAFV